MASLFSFSFLSVTWYVLVYFAYQNALASLDDGGKEGGRKEGSHKLFTII
jgi:hypothetical protein